MHLPDLVAHRGWAKNYPENTLAALRGAIEAGAKFVEIDVQLSSDQIPVLFHDRSLERMCGTSGAVHERTSAELGNLSCGEAGRFGERFQSERIATLEGFVALLRAHPRVHAFVEIKRAALEVFGERRVFERVMATLEPALPQCALISFSIPFLAFVRRRHPIALGAVFDTWQERAAPIVRDLAPEYVFCDLDGLPATGDLTVEGARVAVYEVAEPALAVALAERGVGLVETFAVGEMLRAFSELRVGRQ